MNDSKMVLQAIHENAEMGRETIFHLRRKAEGSFAALLRQQQAQYDSVLAKSGDMLRAMGEKPKRPSWMVRMMTDMGMDMHTLRDHSAPRLAQLLIRGGSMGVSDLRQELKLHPSVTGDVRTLGEELLLMEQTQLRQWVDRL